MRSILIPALFGALAGMGIVYLAFDRGWLAPDPFTASAPVIENVPKMSLAEAEAHRTARFAKIRTIEETRALPGDFAQTEALYALAGRADSAAVQGLVFQANALVDSADRRAALLILFSRLTELDPASALALSQSRYFDRDQDVEVSVWRTWSRLDLDSALNRAASIDSAAKRQLAGDAMLTAYGYWGNATTARITESLGIEPGSAVMTEYLYRLADRDPAAAVAYIHTQGDDRRQWKAAALLGSYLARRDVHEAERIAALIEPEWLARAYRNAIVSESANVAPKAVLDQLLAAGGEPGDMDQAYGAMQVLAERDIEEALAYLENIPNSRLRDNLASVVAAKLARSDPERALAWATENDSGRQQNILTEVLTTIAAERPDLAIGAAQAITEPLQRRQVFAMLAMTMTRRDPQQAVALLDHIERRDEREDLAGNIARSWLQQDADGALAWVLASEFGNRDAMMNEAVQTLAESDLQKAISWLPRVDGEYQSAWQRAIALNLAAQHSFADAQNFIMQFENSDEYPELLASAISGMAQSDVGAAYEMAAQLPASGSRDALFANLIEHQAYRDPQQAATWLASLSEGPQRAMLTAQVAAGWLAVDSVAAEQWVRQMPVSAGRDQAIVQLASHWDEISDSQRFLIDGIADGDTRRQAIINYIYHVVQGDWQKVETVAGDFDLSEEDARRLQNDIESLRNQHFFTSPF